MRYILVTALALTFSAPAFAQPIERETLQPMSQPTYQQDVPMPAEDSAPSPKLMQPIPNPDSVNEQMARDAAAAPPEREVIPATPPPGPDSLPPQSDSVPVENTVPLSPDGSSTVPAGDTRSPAQVSAPPQPGEGFPNGKTPRDESMAKRVFCTLKVSFVKSANATTYDKIKSYIDSNAGTIRRENVKPSKGASEDLCLMIDQHNKRAKTYKDLKMLLPLKSKKPSGITLSGEGFVPVTSRD